MVVFGGCWEGGFLLLYPSWVVYFEDCCMVSRMLGVFLCVARVVLSRYTTDQAGRAGVP